MKASVSELKAPSSPCYDHFNEYGHHANWTPYNIYLGREHSWNVLAKEFVPPAFDASVYSRQDLLKFRFSKLGHVDLGIKVLSTVSASGHNSINSWKPNHCTACWEPLPQCSCGSIVSAQPWRSVPDASRPTFGAIIATTARCDS